MENRFDYLNSLCDVLDRVVEKNKNASERLCDTIPKSNGKLYAAVNGAAYPIIIKAKHDR